MTLRAVTFDVHNTLLHAAEPVPQVYARAARAYGGERTPDEVAAAFAGVFDGGPPPVGGWPTFWRAAIITVTGVADRRLFDELWSHYGRASAWALAPGALETLDRCRDAGLRVGLLSNADDRLRPALGDLGLLERVHAAFLSDEIGFAKPDPRIFHAAAKGLGVAPGALVHVGDSQSADIEGAQAAGCLALHVGPGGVPLAQVPAALGLR
jgi:putative hydrolase of the HAD superfamily